MVGEKLGPPPNCKCVSDAPRRVPPGVPSGTCLAQTLLDRAARCGLFAVTNIGYPQAMDQALQTQILQILKGSPSGLQMDVLADKLGLTRHTVAKYLEVLRAGGAVHYQKVGRSKLWKDIPTTTQIRLLSVDDLEDVLRIEERIEAHHGSEDPERLNHLRETALYHLRQGDPLMNLGAEIDGRLVGFVFAETRLWEFGRGERTGWIKILGVDPEYQARGIGRKLGETLFSHFSRKNIRKIRTLVEWYEGDLISYFRTLGFNILPMIPLEKELQE